MNTEKFVVKEGSKLDLKKHATDFALWKFSPKMWNAKWNGEAPGESVFPAGI